jgi:hypothetical protein
MSRDPRTRWYGSRYLRPDLDLLHQCLFRAMNRREIAAISAVFGQCTNVDVEIRLFSTTTWSKWRVFWPQIARMCISPALDVCTATYPWPPRSLSVICSGISSTRTLVSTIWSALGQSPDFTEPWPLLIYLPPRSTTLTHHHRGFTMNPPHP